LATFSADCRCLCTFGNIATAWRTFHKTAGSTRGLTRLATQIAALYLSTVCTKLNGLRGFGSAGLLAAIYAQKYRSQSCCHHNHQTFLVYFHNQLLSNKL
jgi:hypothetical protein